MALALERGAQRGVKLRVSGAFHTSLMQPAADGMAKAVAAAPLRDALVPIVANTTAEPIASAAALREELAKQLVSPVQWSGTMQFLRGQHVNSLIEFGPGRVLTGLAKRYDRSFAIRNVSDTAAAAATAIAPTPP
jgi:[acyl-carrier-protein] S-malonyltransferase